MSSQKADPHSFLASAGRAELEGVEGIIFDIQRYSLHDGPGLRTNVFFKGCSLRCAWCANPESQTTRPELAVFAVNCIRCGQFDQPCPDGWRVQEDTAWKQEIQADYDTRARLCPAGGVRWIGERRTASSVMDEVRRDALFYEGGGGMTLTGGEPALQPTFAEALLRLAHEECINTAIETCGQVPWLNLERLLPYLDTVLFDVKQLDSATHRACTGAGNELILDNLRRLAAAGAPVMVRVPLIPGFNASAESLRAIGQFVAGLPGNVVQVDLLPYHTLGRAKYAALAQPYPWDGHARLTDDEVEALAGELRQSGLVVTVGG
ncbi:MAG: glycyl-radical enzyme activating protein [Chloroflexi bacterium]|nr:glycyl-radical enzyme activating protein [Chloroflexota bacterium]